MGPIEYPSAVVGGKTYQLKYALGAQLRLTRLGYPPTKLKALMESYTAALAAGNADQSLEVTLLMGAAMLGTVTEGKWRTGDFTVESLADALNRDAEYPALSAAVTEALGKAQPTPEPAQTTAASETGTATG